MVFSSLVFLFLFLPAVLLVNYLVGVRFRNLCLFAASLLFYAWGETFYVLLMLASIGLNYLAGVLVDRFRGGKGALYLTAVAVTVNLGLLAVFKYSDFLILSLNPLLVAGGLQPMAAKNIHLPIGISFFTFQAISYVIDVYRGAASLQRNILNVGLYIALFPQLIAGPIIRYHDVAKQIVQRTTSLADFSAGLQRFIIGLAKKVLIANTVAVTVDKIFALPSESISQTVAWLGIICYSIQIYFDFSGYSDMAIGLGRMLGFKYLENFNYPYISQSIQEFWRRWHISLSNWFRDYLYIPLGGNRRGAARTYFNLFVVFFLCGLWHGGSWTFVVWGAFHGFFIVIEKLGLARILDRLWRPFRHIYALAVVLVSWVFFRSETIDYAVSYLVRMFGGASEVAVTNPLIYYLTLDLLLAIGAGILFSMPCYQLLRKIVKSRGDAATIPLAFSKVAVYLVLFASCIMSLVAGVYNPFIYFRF
jgi:alginate O-acetyltransferase complex protein AlgI